MPRDPAADGVGLAPARVPAVDVARGVAIVAMVVYHLSWDLTFFHLVDWPVEDGRFWRVFRTLIAGSFLTLVGVGLVLAGRDGLNRRRFTRRLAAILAGALAISGATWFILPGAWIFFGILHCIALASLLGLLVLRWPVWLLLAAAATVAALPPVAADPVFDRPWLLWVGLGTVPPVTNDYVPLVPWFAWTLAGVALGRLLLRPGRLTPAIWHWPGQGAAARALAWGGRHSLVVYLVHQPVLIALIAGFVWVSGAGSLPSAGGATPQQVFRQDCIAACDAGDTGLSCVAYCTCLAQAVASAGLLTASDTEETRLAMAGLAFDCVTEREE